MKLSDFKTKVKKASVECLKCVVLSNSEIFVNFTLRVSDVNRLTSSNVFMYLLLFFLLFLACFFFFLI